MNNEFASDLIYIRPLPTSTAECIQCHSKDITVSEIIFQGIHVLTKCYCSHCQKNFFQTLPIGHDFLFPISFDEIGKKVKADKQVLGWLVQPLIDSIIRSKKLKVAIEKEFFEQKQEAIILNCLDNCFGHSFSKLWNASILKVKYPDKSIIVFIPKVMRWLIPDGISEVWSFDASFDELEKYIDNLNDEVQENLFPRFNRVLLHKAYTHLDLTKVDLKALLKMDRFDLNNFASIPPHVTFILREDRFWHRFSLEHFLFKVFVKLGISKRIFVWRQIQCVNKTSKLVKKDFDNVTISATGLGKTGRLSSTIIDKRKIMLTREDEREWCNLYAASHLVIGIHGSNMFIPSALSAGFIEILPRHKIRHMAEETVINYNSRYTLFLGRHLDHFVSPKLVAKHIISMIKDFPYLYRNTQQEI